MFLATCVVEGRGASGFIFGPGKRPAPPFFVLRVEIMVTGAIMTALHHFGRLSTIEC